MPSLTYDAEEAPRSAIRHRPLSSRAQRSPRVATPTPRATLGKPHHEPHTTGGPPSRKQPPRTRGRELFILGIGMLMTLILVFIGQFLLARASTTLDDLRYGRPRTFQTDAAVGHADSASNPSHFIALNLHGHIEIIELAGGDPARAHIYVGPQIYGPGADLVPVTIQFRDAEHTHHPDMIVRFQSSQTVFHNTGSSFQPATQ